MVYKKCSTVYVKKAMPLLTTAVCSHQRCANNWGKKELLFIPLLLSSREPFCWKKNHKTALALGLFERKPNKCNFSFVAKKKELLFVVCWCLSEVFKLTFGQASKQTNKKKLFLKGFKKTACPKRLFWNKTKSKRNKKGKLKQRGNNQSGRVKNRHITLITTFYENFGNYHNISSKLWNPPKFRINPKFWVFGNLIFFVCSFCCQQIEVFLVDKKNRCLGLVVGNSCCLFLLLMPQKQAATNEWTYPTF